MMITGTEKESGLHFCLKKISSALGNRYLCDQDLHKKILKTGFKVDKNTKY